MAAMDAIYADMKARGLTHSQRHFSSAWCGRAGNYMADRDGEAMSDATTTELLRRLVKAGQHDLAQRVFRALLANPAGNKRSSRRGTRTQPK